MATVPNSNEGQMFEILGDTEGVLWFGRYSDEEPIPYCKEHRKKLLSSYYERNLICPKDRRQFVLGNSFHTHAEFIRQEIFDTDMKELQVVRIDPDGYQVISKETTEKHPEFWVESKLSNTSKGLQLMVQVGKKDGSGEKVQLFVEPAAERMDFDRGGSDIHPSGVFTEVTAVFKNSSTNFEAKKKK